MKKLKKNLFRRTAAEGNIYLHMVNGEGYTKTEIKKQASRFYCLFQFLEDYGLTEEYKEWRRKHEK